MEETDLRLGFYFDSVIYNNDEERALEWRQW